MTGAKDIAMAVGLIAGSLAILAVIVEMRLEMTDNNRATHASLEKIQQLSTDGPVLVREDLDSLKMDMGLVRQDLRDLHLDVARGCVPHSNSWREQ